ncbi:MAG TPA: hypothetical protein VMR88_07350, partial [Candidatus Polarisedimenticolaceae bacterium]|nr:hypothetical protein [Candidatus Polarisedimenticolaceae bacterium]
DVDRIEVSIPPMRYQRHFHAEVKTGLRGKFAINYVVALGILEGKLDNDTFTDGKANDPLVQQALRRVYVIIDDSIPEPGTYCPVTIELKNGKRLSHTARIAKGHPENPMTESEVLAKFRNNANGIISAERSQQLIGALKNLEELADLRELAGFLRPA